MVNVLEVNMECIIQKGRFRWWVERLFFYAGGVIAPKSKMVYDSERKIKGDACCREICIFQLSGIIPKMEDGFYYG